MAKVYNFTISNEDIIIRFSCPNHNRRIEEIVKNLCTGNSNDTDEKKICRYTILEGNGTFAFDGIDEIGNDIRHEVVFFENTEYPLIVKGRNNVLEEISLAINDHQKDVEDSKSTIISDNGELYGSMNFRNQVGMTDMTFTYKVNGQTKKLKFMTEVLSYKLDYRTDLKTIISDIENEYALLSASFLKDTYLSMRQKNGESSSLIWWQIFKSCYQEIIKAAKIIIDRPKRRLRTVARYERAERMAFLPRELENEYQTHKDNPAYLYRTEEMILSHDTIENRFLKHAINEMLRKFLVVKEHIITAMHLDNPMNVDTSLTSMESEMLRLRNHSFFRGVGVFKGFTQDNLVMKQALGYKTIMEKWVELQQGYELEEGLRKLEVKDVCDLYEIWCFIKVKNIVQDTLRELGKNATPKVKGRYVTKDFIPQLVYGGTMIFEEENGAELACVRYNAQVEKETSNKVSFIEDTDSMTTIQRPDIVLSLSKTNDTGMKYTYLFDAKYRINDTQIKGNDVPPEDAINQMHRYRDAIYFTKNGSEREDLKKEVIAGYVLFPGRVPLEALDLENGDYHYQVSNRKIGIGAFPLRPSKELRAEDGSVIIDPTSSEQALRKQIRKWLETENAREQLLEQSIPQRGLEYSDEPVMKGTYFLSSIDTHVNTEKSSILNGEAKLFYTGYSAILTGIDFQKIKYFAPVENHEVAGYYKVLKVSAKDMSERLSADKSMLEALGKSTTRYKGYEKPIRICLVLGEFVKLPNPFRYGLDQNAAKGVTLSRREFNEYCKKRS